ncbi:outer membrane autotransporter [Oxalobacteraceae bacterium IMCC9480]|nr:outer membrane autotransporter [Oxalobacteraceae bacterium IMCC9480]
MLTTTRDQNTGNGIGSILFGSGPNAYYGSIRVGTPGTALTIDTGVTVTSNGQFGSTIDLGTGGIVKGTIDGQAGRTSITGTRWQNQGTIKSSGGDIALSGDHWVNTASGLIQANAGGISIDGLPVNNGTLEVASAATMTTTNHNLINAASGIIRGTGTLDLGVTGTPPVDPSMPWTYQLNTLTNHGTIDPGMGASGTGTLTVLGNLAMASDGKFHVDLGGVTPGLYDQLVVAGQPLNSYYSPNTGYFPTPSALARLDGQLEIAETGNAISGAFFAGKGDTFANLVTVNGGTSGLTGSFASNRIATPTPADVAFTFATSGAPGISDTTTSVTRWASSASGDWAGADNWTRGVPKNNQDAVVRFSAASTSGSGIASVTINSDVATPASLLLDADLTLATGGAFTLPWNLTTISSVVRLAGGTLTNPNALTMNGLLLLESGTIDGAGSLTMAYGGPGLPTDAGLPGTVVKSTPGIVNINQAFGNTTSIRVLDGQLALNGSGIHTGSFDVASGAILNFGGGVQQFADGSVFSNTGSFVRRTESAQLTGNTSGLTIAADSTLDLTAFGFSGSGNLTNLGTIDGNNITLNGLLLNKGIANLSGTTLLAGGFRNSDAGTLHIGPGNITVEGAVSTLAGGSIDLAGGATLTKSGGTLDWAGGTFGGAGTLAFTNGGLIGFSGSGERTLDNANLQFAFTDLNLPSGSLILRNGALTFNTSAAGATVIPVATTLAVYGGTLTNNGPLDIAGVFGLYGGTLAGSGSINMTGGTIDMPATSSVNWTASGALTNSGTLNLSGRTITSAITNTGTINSTGGLLFTQDFTNDGTFSATAGTTTFAGSFVQNSGFTRLGTGVTAPANLAVGGAGFRLNGGTLGGSGTLSGNLAVAGGTLSPGFSPGSLTITGNLDLSASGTTTIELGGLIPGSGFDVINVGGIANLAGVLNVASYGGYVAAAGTTYNFLNFGASSGRFSSINLPTATGMTYSTQGNFSQLAALALPVAPTVVTPPAIAVALPPATTPPAQAPASATELPTLAVLVTPQQAAIVNLARGRDSAVVVDFPAPAITPPKPGTLVGTARPGAGAIDAIDSAAQRTEPSWYLQDDGVVPYFRNLPLASIDKAELSTMLSDRKTYKAQLFAPATALLEANPALADLPPCVQGQEVDSGTCMVNEALQTILLKKMAGDEQPSSGAHASLPAIARKRALVIGLNSYADKRIPQLASALPDAMAIGDAFSSQLGYAVTRLENPTKAQIMQALRRIARDMAPADSVVIYFAGHGDMVEKTGEGYWIPSDARADVPSGWISNADVSRALAQIKARQVAMISDSCYSGTFAREQTVQSGQEHTAANAEAYLRKRTVTVMTSGSDEPVADTGKRGHSVFAWNLMEQIKQLDNWSAGTSVFATVRVEVERALPQSPQYGASLSAGHEAGGDFLFERRDRIQ